jgi:hypothetical protein
MPRPLEAAVKVARAEGGRVAGDEEVDHREPEIDRLLTRRRST